MSQQSTHNWQRNDQNSIIKLHQTNPAGPKSPGENSQCPSDAVRAVDLPPFGLIAPLVAALFVLTVVLSWVKDKPLVAINRHYVLLTDNGFGGRLDLERY